MRTTASRLKKLAIDTGLELSGLNSLKRLYEEDVKPLTNPVMKKLKRTFKKSKQSKTKAIVTRSRARGHYGGRLIGYDGTLDLGKRNLIVAASKTNLNSRVLYHQLLTVIPHSGSNQINGRTRNVVDVTGFHLSLSFVNQASDTPLWLNVAVIQNKQDGTTAAPALTDFFRGTGLGRGTDFSTALNSHQFHYSHINSDLYVIMRHNRYELNSSTLGATYHERTGRNYVNLEWWVPFGKVLAFDSDIDTSPVDGNVFLVYWYDEMLANPTSASLVGLMVTSARLVVHFKDHHSCSK